jgi:hypothetical protein
MKEMIFGLTFGVHQILLQTRLIFSLLALGRCFELTDGSGTLLVSQNESFSSSFY